MRILNKMELVGIFRFDIVVKQSYQFACIFSKTTSYNQVSNFGKFMDPLADKMLVLAAMCFFIENGQMPGWVVAVVLFREFAVSGLRLIAVEQSRVIAAAWSGKIKTASTMVGLCVMMLFPAVHLVNIICSAVILLTTVYSGVEYFWVNRDVFKDAD